MGERIGLREEFWHLVVELIEESEKWHRRWVSQKIFFNHFPQGHAEIELISQEILDDVLGILLGLFTGEESRKGFSPDPGMAFKAYVLQISKKRNHARDWRSKYSVGVLEKDLPAIKSSRRYRLVFASFASVDQLQSGPEAGYAVGAPIVEPVTGDADAMLRDYALSRYIERLSDESKMAYLLVERGLATASVEMIRKQAQEMGVGCEALCRYVDQLERRRRPLKRDDVAAVLDVTQAKLERILKKIFQQAA